MAESLNSKTYLQRLQTVAYLYLGAPLVLFIYAYLESSVDELEEIVPFEYHLAVLFPIVLLCSILMYAHWKQHRLLTHQISMKPGLPEKLALYKSANNRRFMYFGLCALLITIGFYLTNFQPFAALFGLMIVLFSIYNPSSRRIVQELKLRDEEKKIIMNGEDIEE